MFIKKIIFYGYAFTKEAFGCINMSGNISNNVTAGLLFIDE